MDIAGKVVVITGAAGGIGAAMARRFAAEGAATLVLTDLDGDAAAALAADINKAGTTEAGTTEAGTTEAGTTEAGTSKAGSNTTGTNARAVALDVTDENQVAELVAEIEERDGRIDLFCANAGITTGAGLEASAETWSRAWAVNVQSHVSSARAVLPGMLERGQGYLLHTCSAAGLLTAVGDAPYAVTKHAAVAFAEWLSITYGARGIKVSALCPQGVDTPMLQEGLAAGHIGAKVTAAGGAVLSAESVAGSVVEGLAAERFLILPHPEVQKYYLHRAGDTDRWLAGMRGLAAGLEA